MNPLDVGSTFASNNASTMPITTPPSSVIGSDTIRAMSTAASALTSSDGPSASLICVPADSPSSGTIRIAVSAESAPANAQTMVDIRFGRTPANRAASGFAAAARIA